MLIKSVNVEHLPKETNFEIRTNLKKPPTSVRGIFSFTKLHSDKYKRKTRDEDGKPLEEKSETEKGKKDKDQFNIYEHLAKGKDLKRVFKDLKPMKDLV